MSHRTLKKGQAAAGLNEDVQLEIAGRPVAAAVGDTVLTVELDRNMYAASTITLVSRDPGHVLEHQGYFEQDDCEAKLDGLAFIACSFSKKADEFQLKFEDREFALLARDHTKFRMEQKGPSTNIQHFFQAICKRVVPHAEFVTDWATIPRVGPKPAKTTSKSRSSVKKGVSRTAIKLAGGVTPHSSQLAQVNTVLEVCDALGAPPEARIAILEAGLAETAGGGFQVDEKGPEGAVGVFQINPAAHPPSVVNAGTKQNAEEWLKSGFSGHGGGIALANAGKKAGEIALLVEEPNKGADFFEQHRPEAEAIVAAAGGGEVGTGATTAAGRTVEKASVFETGYGKEEEENTLKTLEAYAKKYNWRFFIARRPTTGNPAIHFLPDTTLAQQKPVLEIDDGSPGVVDISYEFDKKESKQPSTVTIEARAHLWTPDIGETIRFTPKAGNLLAYKKSNTTKRGRVKAGKATLVPQTWIVDSIERKDITDNACTVTVSLPQAPNPEQIELERLPATRTRAQVVKSPSSPLGSIQNPGGGPLGESSVALNIYLQAKWISEQHYQYHLGGGHSGFHADPVGFASGPKPSKLTELEGLDCSGAASWAFHTAGAWPGITANAKEERGFVSGTLHSGIGPMDTTSLKQLWGVPGVGKYVTLWVSPSHCFVWIQIPGHMRPEGGPDIDYAFEASHTGATTPAPHGVGLRPRLQYYSNPGSEGFSARHWEGT